MRQLTIVFFSFYFIASSQAQNLLDNPSFIYGLLYWNTILSVDEYEGSGGYCQEGSVHSSDASGCAGVRFYHQTFYPDEHNWQEYIFQNISSEMVQDTVYRVSIKYFLAPRCSTATNVMGIGFFSGYNSDTDITRELIQHKTPDVSNVSGQLLDNNTQYQELVGYYKATGNEDFVAFGAFHKDSGMVRLPVSSPPPDPSDYNNPMAEILYYLDEAKVVPCNDYPHDQLPDEQIFCQTEQVHLEAHANNASFLWSNGSTDAAVDVIANNQDVWVQITKNGCVFRDTVRLTVFSGTVDLGADRALCSTSDFPVLYTINALPNESVVWSNGTTGNNTFIKGSGTYWVTKTVGSCIASDTVTLTELSAQSEISPNPVKTTFSFNTTEVAMVHQIITDDGRYVFKGEEELSNLDALIISLQSATYFIDAEIDGCRIFRKFEKIKMNE